MVRRVRGLWIRGSLKSRFSWTKIQTGWWKVVCSRFCSTVILKPLVNYSFQSHLSLSRTVPIRRRDILETTVSRVVCLYPNYPPTHTTPPVPGEKQTTKRFYAAPKHMALRRSSAPISFSDSRPKFLSNLESLVAVADVERLVAQTIHAAPRSTEPSVTYENYICLFAWLLTNSCVFNHQSPQ